MPIQAEIRQMLYEEIVRNVPFDGWTDKNLANASKKLGYPENYAKILWSRGIPQLIEMFISNLDRAMLAEFKKSKDKKMGVTQKVKEALRIRFEIMIANKVTYSRALQYLALPWNSPSALRFSWNTADVIWYDVVGDRVTDFNYYTKRTLLSGIYTAALIFFMSDSSPYHEDTFDFIERRVNTIVKIGKNLSKFKNKNA